jgi:hypothetical protein
MYQSQERPGSIADARSANETVKRERQVDTILNMVLRANDGLREAVNRTDEMRGRLLGLRDPAKIEQGRGGEVPAPPSHELAELRLGMERMGGMLEKLHSNLRDLEGI